MLSEAIGSLSQTDIATAVDVISALVIASATLAIAAYTRTLRDIEKNRDTPRLSIETAMVGDDAVLFELVNAGGAPTAIRQILVARSSDESGSLNMLQSWDYLTPGGERTGSSIEPGEVVWVRGRSSDFVETWDPDDESQYMVRVEPVLGDTVIEVTQHRRRIREDLEEMNLPELLGD